MSATQLDNLTAFRLFARACLRDGEVDDWERRRLLGLASVLRLDEPRARQVLLEVRDEVRTQGLVAGAGAEPEVLYRSLLAAALADGVASPSEVRILLAVRQILNVDDTTHAAILAELMPASGASVAFGLAKPGPVSAGPGEALLARARDLEAHVSALALDNRLGAPEEEAAEAALRAALSGLWEELNGARLPEDLATTLDAAVRLCAVGLARCGEAPGSAMARLARAEAREANTASRFPDKSRAEVWLADAVLARVHRRLEDGLFTEARVMLREAQGAVSSPEVKLRLERELELATIPVTPPKRLGGELALSKYPVIAQGVALAALASIAELQGLYIALAAVIPLLTLFEHVHLDDTGLDFRLGLTRGRIEWARIRGLAALWGFQTYKGQPMRTRPPVAVGTLFFLTEGVKVVLPVPAGPRYDVCRQLHKTLVSFLGPVLLRRDLRTLEQTGRLVLGDFTLDRNGLTVEGDATEGDRRRFQWSELESVGLEETRLLVRRKIDPEQAIELRTWATPNLFTLHHVLRERGLAKP